MAILVVETALILMASFLPAPIAPAMTGNPIVTEEVRAPWFFLWVQQMLKWGDPFIFGILIPLGLLALLALIPYILPKPADGDIGRWFPRSNRLAQIIVSAIALIVITLALLALIP